MQITLIQDYTGHWQPSCGATADRLHAIGIDFGPDGISPAALDDVVWNCAANGLPCVETIPLPEVSDATR